MWIFGNLRSGFGRGGFARDAATLTVGTIVAQGITVASMPLLGRLYTPAEFGALAVFVAVAGVVAATVTFRYETAILLPKADSEAATVVLLTLLLATLVTVGLWLGSTLLPVQAARAIGAGSLSFWLPVAVLAGGCIAIVNVAQGWLNRKRQYPAMSGVKAGQSAAVVVLAVIFGATLTKANGLLLAQALGYGVAVCLALWLARSVAPQWQPRLLRQVARTQLAAPKYLWPTALLDVVTLQLPVVLVSAWFGANVTGQFSMAWRVLMLPMSLIGAAVGQVFFQRFTQRIRTDPSGARRLLIKTWRHLLVLGLVPMLVLIAWGGPIFAWGLGALWRSSGHMAAILAPMAFAMFVSSPTSTSFIALGLQRYNLIFGIAVFIYRPLCLLVGHFEDSLTLALVLWSVLEVVQIVVYQLVALKGIRNRS